ncbi:DNA methyltransferase [Enterococcus faecium]|uniref:DNA methyltransferase n=1 Tax=Enterococcus faecium TaxID=1352 RepID=UPI000F6430A8|nr:site-specific DNA-methyltransferase [Enterococcus faecium]RRQ56115.1 type III restriction endonuclease subunit M [Enterococcus faecium]RRQ90754.1 type III restriction endonuclease subunit M [Enterococcus faecium]
MAKIEPKIFDELKTVLVSFGNKYFVGEELNRSKLTDDLRNYDEALLSKLFEIDFIKNHFIKEVAGQKLFQIEQLEAAVLYNDYWDTSYTKYENRVGLASKGKFLQDSQDVVLDFPFKDCVLTASMTKEDNEDGYDDAFLNEVIEKDEIDRLFDKKVFVNVKRFGDNQTAQHSTEVDNGIVSFDKEKDNLIIKGNNLLALHTLADKYAGQIKLIYIDPPYNTGADSFKYNDKFNHSTWMTFMKNRLEIARELLSDDGCIWMNIDDDEGHYLKVLADGVFGRDNFINTVIWEKKYTVSNDAKYLSDNHDLLLFYAKNKTAWKPNPLPRTDEMNKAYKNPDNHPKGVWKSTPLHAKSGSINGEEFSYTFSNGVTWRPPIGTFPRFSKETLERLDNEGAIYFGKDGTAIPSRKTFLSELKNQGIPARTVWRFDEVGHNHQAREEIKNLNLDSDFTTPKPEKLIQRIFTLGSDENDLVLDFFMGSATTQAVAMKMSRRFIGIEQMDYINTVAVPRLEKVIEGEQGGISKDVNWQGGGSFVYAELFPKNMGYLQDVIHAKDLEELKSVYERMLSGTDTDEPADISFRADLSKIDWLQGFDENKRLLVKLIDKNGLYYNFSEIDDKNVRDLISDEDYTFNKNFYEGGD